VRCAVLCCKQQLCQLCHALDSVRDGTGECHASGV
jgi:hypothetical protein